MAIQPIHPLASTVPAPLGDPAVKREVLKPAVADAWTWWTEWPKLGQECGRSSATARLLANVLISMLLVFALWGSGLKWPAARAYGLGWGFLGLLLLQGAVMEGRRWRVGYRREPLLYALLVVAALAVLYVIPTLLHQWLDRM